MSASRARALELVGRYDPKQLAGKTVDEGTFTGASPGFLVLDLKNAHFEEQTVDKDLYVDFTDYVNNKQRRLSKSERRKNMRTLQNALRPRPDLVKPKEKKGKKLLLKNKVDSPKSPKSPQSPIRVLDGNSSHMDSSHYYEVAWRGVPENLQKMYYPGEEIEPQVDSPLVALDTEEEKRLQALRFVEEYRHDNDSKNQRAWVESKALRRVRARPRSANDVPGKREKLRGRKIEAVSPRPTMIGYTEMCKRARAQILKEREEMLKTLEQRRGAAIIIQRALRRVQMKEQAKWEAVSKQDMEVQIQANYARKLQAAYRGFSARRSIQVMLNIRERAARKIQGMVRNSYNWKRIAKQRAKLKQRIQVVESIAERDHFEWIQRVVSRSKNETEYRRKSSLAMRPEEIRDYVKFVPRSDTGEDEEEDKSKTKPPRMERVVKNRLVRPPRAIVPRLSISVVERTPRKKVVGSARTPGEIPRHLRHRGLANKKNSLTSRFERENHIQPDEFEAMNNQLRHALSDRVGSVEKRVGVLKTALHRIVAKEKALPALKFSTNLRGTG
mmetsp:Transcript_1638/g.2558  ORF Transcript_1638/g.2558 Transcript_1638/m.2558 type:complete len:556 (+) Transcript_1638:210-1877(+)